MSGCVEINKDSYVVAVKEIQNVNVFVNGVATPTTDKVFRTTAKHRLGKGWMNFVSTLSDPPEDVERIRKGRIAIERLKDVTWCHPFPT